MSETGHTDEDKVVINTTVVEITKADPDGRRWMCIYHPDTRNSDDGGSCLLAVLQENELDGYDIADESPAFIAIPVNVGNAPDGGNVAIAGIVLVDMVSPGDEEHFDKWMESLISVTKLISYDGDMGTEIDNSKFVHFTTPSEVMEFFNDGK